MNEQNQSPNPENIIKDIATSLEVEVKIYQPKYLNELKMDPEWEEKNNLLGNGFLRRTQSLLLAAPTGIGKSSFSMQAMILWSLGKLFFGIKPNGKLKILMIQAENDDGDLCEMRDGIFKGLGLSEEDQKEACRMIQIVTITSETGESFVETVKNLTHQHRPDLVWIDPLFSYLGDNVSEQKATSKFLRNGLNPILKEFQCALVLVHHTNKPIQGKEKTDWRAGDFAYLGSGSAELANWARGVVGIRSLGSFTVYEVILGKRGKRAGIVDEKGQPVLNFYIKHGKEGICWDFASQEEAKQNDEKKPPKTPDVVLALVSETGSVSMAWLINEAKKYGIGQNTTKDFVKLLVEERKLFVWKTARSGTHPEKSYSRHPQQTTFPNMG